jgi:hypothetical protein
MYNQYTNPYMYPPYMYGGGPGMGGYDESAACNQYGNNYMGGYGYPGYNPSAYNMHAYSGMGMRQPPPWSHHQYNAGMNPNMNPSMQQEKSYNAGNAPGPNMGNKGLMPSQNPNPKYNNQTGGGRGGRGFDRSNFPPRHDQQGQQPYFGQAPYNQQGYGQQYNQSQQPPPHQQAGPQ